MDRNGALLIGDIIKAIDGEVVASVPDVDRELDDRNIGDEVVLTIERAGRELEVPVTLQRER
jgi:S1-C subfamily serine protease